MREIHKETIQPLAASPLLIQNARLLHIRVMKVPVPLPRHHAIALRAPAQCQSGERLLDPALIYISH